METIVIPLATFRDHKNPYFLMFLNSLRDCDCSISFVIVIVILIVILSGAVDYDYD